ncbi:transcriptional repressor NrdR [Candidatus Woesearchaeota archaeon]|nr:transcriptional repressor NrdR [Candidatus Woesearchaeota archaeon]
MKCPYCNHSETKVVDKRETDDLDVTRRRRECLKCGKRFTTYERVEGIELIIVKKDGRREAFDKEKLKRGLVRACEKRPVPVEQIDKIIDKVEAEIRRLDTKEVRSSIVGDKITKELKKLDQVAYIRFASVYRSFADVTDFQKELKDLLKDKKR